MKGCGCLVVILAAIGGFVFPALWLLAVLVLLIMLLNNKNPSTVVYQINGGEENHPAPTSNREALGKLFIFGCAGLVIFLLVRSLISSNKQTDFPTPSYQYPTNVVPQPTATPKIRTKVMDQFITINSHEHFSVPFSIGRNAFDARIFGGFKVIEGSKINVGIMSRRDYERYLVGGKGDDQDYFFVNKSNYKLGVRLPPGDYNLLFINLSAQESSTVAAEFDLEY